jgi:EmrB/QacA subfamily drug resistance transporter
MEAFPVDSGVETPDLEHDPALGLERRAKFEILGAILLGLFLGALDQTVVGTALPKIVTDLGGNELYTWVVTIYLLTSTITVPFYGKLSDLYGRKPFLLGGIALFLVGSALSGLSQEMWQLILFRGIQGIGAGSLFPISLAVIGDLFTPAERGKYQGLFGAVFGISFLVGPALGGFLTDSVSWHWVFYVNIPIGILALAVIWRLLPNIKHPNVSRDLDYLGGLIFTVAIGFLLVGLTNKQTGDWADVTVGGFIAIAVALLAVFLVVEARAKEPILPLGLWRNRTYAASLVATFFVSFGFFGAVIFLPRWFQVVRAESATASGYLMFPLLVGLIGSSIISGALVARTGRYKAILLFSIATMVVGIGLMTQLTADTDFPPLWAWMFVTGVGIGPTLAVFTIAVQNAVPFRELGVATSNLTFFRQIGGSVGLAIAGTVFATQLQNDLPNRLRPIFTDMVSKLPPQFQGQAQAGLSQLSQGGSGNLQDFTGVGQSFGQALLHQVPAPFQQFVQPYVPQLDHAFFESLSSGIAATFIVAIVTSIVALVATVFMKEIPLRRTTGAAAPAAEMTGGADSTGSGVAGPAAGLPGAAASFATERAGLADTAASVAAEPAALDAPAARAPAAADPAVPSAPTILTRVEAVAEPDPVLAAVEPSVGPADPQLQPRNVTVRTVAAVGALAIVGFVAARGHRNPVTGVLRLLRLR